MSRATRTNGDPSAPASSPPDPSSETPSAAAPAERPPSGFPSATRSTQRHEVPPSRASSLLNSQAAVAPVTAAPFSLADLRPCLRALAAAAAGYDTGDGRLMQLLVWLRDLEASAEALVSSPDVPLEVEPVVRTQLSHRSWPCEPASTGGPA